MSVVEITVQNPSLVEEFEAPTPVHLFYEKEQNAVVAIWEETNVSVCSEITESLNPDAKVYSYEYMTVTTIDTATGEVEVDREWDDGGYWKSANDIEAVANSIFDLGVLWWQDTHPKDKLYTIEEPESTM